MGRVLVNAARRGIGSAAVQVARLAGARVIATAGSAAKLQRALELGADAAVNYSTPGWSQEVRERTNGDGILVAEGRLEPVVDSVCSLPDIAIGHQEDARPRPLRQDRPTTDDGHPEHANDLP